MIPDDAIIKAKELASGLTQKQRYMAITEFINRNFVYDFVKALTIKRYGGKPDPEGCWQKHMGICGDLSALTVAMLHAAGLEANLVVGHADGIYHAWVESAYGIYDPTAEIQKKKVAKYTKEKIC